MTTYQLVTLIVSICGVFLTATIATVRALVTSVKAIQKLTDAVESLTQKFDTFEVNNHDDHKRIWEHNDEQDDKLDDHEKRLIKLER